jgi:hypothetical protein
MKQLFFIAFLPLVLLACKQGADKVGSDHLNFPSSANGQLPEHLPEITFKDSIFDFGTILEGEKVSYTFEFENTGDADLVLVRVETSCGCTAPKSWPREPIAPGETGQIEVTFDSNQKTGFQNKSIQVVANTYPATNQLFMTGEVLGPDNTKQK